MRTTPQPRQRKKKTVVRSTHGRCRFADAFLTPLPFDGSLLSLESRIMFDGAAVTTAGSVTTEQVAQQQAEPSFSADATTTADTAPPAPTGEPAPTNTDQALFDALAAYDTSAARQEIVFLSPSVREYLQLLDGISPNVQVIVLDPSRDGVEQMAEVLAGRRDLHAIHIISHGAEAELLLGSARLTLESMNGVYADELAAIGQSLSENADLLIYGCNFGQGELGQQAAGRLAELTGADVAASTDNTGHADLGGDWDLEWQAGDIETALVLSDAVTKQWMGLLAENILESYEPIFTNMTDQAYEIKSDQSWGQTFSYDSPGVTYTVNRVGLVLYRDSGSASQVITVSLRSSWNGAVIASGQVSSASLGTTEAWVHIDLTTPATLTDNATYYIRVDSNSNSGRVFVGVHDAGLYGNGDLINVSGAPETPKDLAFRIIEATANAAPVITNLNGDTLAYNEGDGAVVIEQGNNATVNDVDSTDFDTGSLVVSFVAGSDSAEDVLAIRNEGAGAGQIGVSGSNVTYGGVTIGTFTGGSGGTNLVVTFNSSATPAAAQALTRNITYENTDTDAPTSGARTVRFQLTDGDGGTSGGHNTTVTVSGVNDPPVITVPVAQSTALNTVLVFSVTNGNALSISDVDAGGSDVRVTLTGTNGTVTLSGTTGLTFSVGDGTGDATMTFTGAVANINAALNGMSFTPTAGYTGSATMQINTNDQGNSGSGGPQGAANIIPISVVSSSLWVSSKSNATVTALYGGISWTDGEIINFGNPNLSFEPGTTNGTFSGIGFNLDTFAGSNEDINSLHYVKRTVTVNGITLNRGDVLFTPDDSANVGGVAIDKNMVVLFQPTTPGDYSAGTFSVLLNDPAGREIWGMALVEKTTTVGDATLNPGEFLFTLQGGGFERSIWRWRPATGLDATELVRGDAINISQTLSSIELVQDMTVIGNATLTPGQILLSVDSDDSTVGTNSIAVKKYDIFLLDVTTTGTSSVANATLLFDGSKVAISSGGEEFDAITLVSTASQPPTVTLPGGPVNYTENDAATIIDAMATVTDADSGDFNTGVLIVDFAANGTANDRLAIRDQGTGPGQIGVSGSTVTYGGVVIGTFTGGVDGSTPLVINFNSSSSPTAAQALIRNITFQNVSDAPSTTARTVRFTVTDGDGGTSNAATKTIAVTAVNDAPVLTTNSPLPVPEESTQTISSAYLSATDPDHSPTQIIYTLTSLPSGGTVRLNGSALGIGDTFTQDDINNNRVTYRDSDEGANASFSFTISDGIATIGPATFVINGQPVNDAPLLDASRSPVLSAIAEDTGAPAGAVGTLISQLVDFAVPVGQVDNVTDPDAGALLGIAVTAADTTNGSWYYSTNNGSNWFALGAVTNNNARLLAADANTRIYFQPNANYNGTLANAVTFRAWDRTTGTNGGMADTSTNGDTTAFSSATDTAAITVTPVNDAPAGTNTTVTTAEDTAYVFTVADFGFTDVDAGDALSAVRIDSLPLAGSLTLSGIGVTAGQVITQANITAGNLVFTPAANANGVGYASFTFSVRDTGGPVFDPTPNTLMIDVTPVNDAPTVTAIADQVILEDSTTGPLAFTVGDVETAVGALTVTAASSNTTIIPNGNLTLLDLGGGNWTIEAVPTADQFGGPVTITVTVDDGTTTTSESFAVTVTPVNDAPLNTVPGAQGTPQNAPLVFSAGNGNAITVADVDVGAGALQVTLTATNGTVLVGPVVGAATVSGDGSATVTITGSVGDVNSALSGMSFTPDLNYNGAAGLMISADDQGNTGTGGARSDTDVITITVANNVPAAVSMSAGALTYTENDPPIVVDPNLTVADPDNAVLDHAHMTITGGYVNGEDLLEYVFNPLLPAITASWNAATGELTLAGAASPAEYQQALRTVTYRNLSEAPSAALRTITVEVEDGISVDAGSSANRTLNVTPVNDAPTGADNTVVVAEDGSRAFAAADFGFADVDTGDTLSAIRIDTLSIPVGATLQLSGVNVNAGDVILTAQLGNLVFTPAANANGLSYASFTFSVQDQASAFDPTPKTLTVDVTPVNDAPVNTVPGAQVVAEDTPLALGGVNVTDVDGNLSTMQVAVVNGTVTVTLQGSASISAGANGSSTLTLWGTEADINATLATLSYQGTLNYTGPETLTITSGDAGSLTDLDTVTITITPVNDAPVVTSNGGGSTANVTVPENGTVVTTVTSSDVDGGTAVYSIVPVGSGGGADAARFTINSSTGVLSFVAAPDYEAPADVGADNVYDVTVQVSDGNGGTTIQALSIMVTDVAEGLPPTPPPQPIPPSLVPQPPAPPPSGGPPTSGSPPIVVSTPISPEPNPDTLVAPLVPGNDPGGTAPSPSEVTGSPAPKDGNTPGPSVPFMSQLRGYVEERVSPLIYTDEEVKKTFAGQTLERAPAPLSAAFRKTLGIVDEDLRRATDTSESHQQFVVRVTNIGGMTLTAGVVTWLLRAGSLLASLTATLPAWRHFDPLPVVLVGGRERRKRKADTAAAAEHENKQFRGLRNLLDRKGANERSDGGGMAA